MFRNPRIHPLLLHSPEQEEGRDPRSARLRTTGEPGVAGSDGQGEPRVHLHAVRFVEKVGNGLQIYCCTARTEPTLHSKAQLDTRQRPHTFFPCHQRPSMDCNS